MADDDNFLAMPSGIGEIKLLISEISIKRSKTPVLYTGAVPELAQKVHERSKKGIVHGVRSESVV